MERYSAQPRLPVRMQLMAPVGYRRVSSRAYNQRKRRGSAMVEQIALLALLGILATVSIRGIARLLDATWVHIATRDIADLIALAREQAAATGARAAVRFDVAASHVAVHAGTDTVARYDLAQHGHVVMEATRDSMAYAPSGLGFGAANLRVVIRKGASAETLTVSRLGRVKR
jgi:hypothetical protein